MIMELYEKYKATHYQDLPTINPLSFILRKAELGHDLTVSEWDWLRQHQQIKTIEIIKNQEDYRTALYKDIHQEIVKLRENRFIPFSFIKQTDATSSLIDSERAFILYKVNMQQRLSISEQRFINKDYHQFLDTVEFLDKKQKHGIKEDIPFDSKSKAILEMLDKKITLLADDIEYLCIHKAHSFLTPLQNQFSQLRHKYKAIVQNEFNGNALRLFHILQTLDENRLLNQEQTAYLKENGFIETQEIAQQKEFSALKIKYRATQIQEDDISHHLFKVLKKLDVGLSLPEPDINYLKKRKLFETVKFVYKKEVDSLNHKIEQGHGLRPDDVAWCKTHSFEDIIFNSLKYDYRVNDRQDGLDSPLYAILQKLKVGNRLTDEDAIWLEGEKLLGRASKIYIAHHALEARFYEHEFQRTKGYWNLASASAAWRKAEKPQQALKQTHDLDFKKIKPAKLAAALLTTRGGALRDLWHLDTHTKHFNEAEQCALEAIKYYPDSHNPYTLLGALYYDIGDYNKGDRWFDEAIKRGAEPRDQDAEIKRILRKKKPAERQELINHLLQKDPYRFAWVNDFITDRKNGA